MTVQLQRDRPLPLLRPVWSADRQPSALPRHRPLPVAARLNLALTTQKLWRHVWSPGTTGAGDGNHQPCHQPDGEPPGKPV